MIRARAIDKGDCYKVHTFIGGTGSELESEARAILKAIWSLEHGSLMIKTILSDFNDWITEQTKEEK